MTRISISLVQGVTKPLLVEVSGNVHFRNSMLFFCLFLGKTSFNVVKTCTGVLQYNHGRKVYAWRL